MRVQPGVDSYWLCRLFVTPHVLTVLKITGALDLKQDWKDIVNDSDDSHTLLDIELKENNHIEITSEHFILHVEVAASSKLILEDVSEPERKRCVTDFSRSIFQGLSEIEKLRNRAQQDNQPDRE